MAMRGRPRAYDREDALRKAMHVFWAKGFEGASLNDLTTAMALKPPSLYAAFGSKEGLFEEAISLYSKEEGSGIWDMLSVAETAFDAVRHVLVASANAFTQSDHPKGCMIVLAAPQPNGANQKVCDALRALRAQNITLLEERFEQAKAAGELCEEADTHAIAAYYVSVQHGMTFTARDGASRETLLAVAHCALAAWPALTQA